MKPKDFWIERVGLSGGDAPGITVFLISDSFDDDTVKALAGAAGEPLDYEARWALGDHEDHGACFFLEVNLGGEAVIRTAVGVPADEEKRRTLIAHLTRADNVALCHRELRVAIDNPPAQILWLAVEPDLERVVSSLDALPVPDLSPLVPRLDESEVGRLREFDERVTELMARPLLVRNHGLGVRTVGGSDLLSDAEERKALFLDARPLLAQNEPGSFRRVLNIVRRRARESGMEDAVQFFGLFAELESAVRTTELPGGSAEQVLDDVLNGFVFHSDLDRRRRLLEHHSRESALFLALSVVRRLGIVYVLTQRLVVRPCLATFDR